MHPFLSLYIYIYRIALDYGRPSNLIIYTKVLLKMILVFFLREGMFLEI